MDWSGEYLVNSEALRDPVGRQYYIRIWESGEWQTRIAECRQRSANPLPGKQMVVALKRKRLGEMPSLP